MKFSMTKRFYVHTLPFFTFLLLFSGCAFVVRTPAVPEPKVQKPGLLRGVYHVHSEFSHDSKASLDRIVKTARRAGLDFVVVTDHNTLKGAEAYRQRNVSAPPLLIFANEISTRDGHLTALGVQTEPPSDKVENPKAVVDWIHAEGGYAIVAHPLSPKKPWTNWEVQDYDGIEIYSFADVYYTQEIKSLVMKSIFLPPRLFLKSVIKTPDAYLRLWDEKSRERRIPAFASVDAHLRYLYGGFAPENYLLYFQAATMYVLIEPPSTRRAGFQPEADPLRSVAEYLPYEGRGGKGEGAKIIDSLVKGRSFMAFEARGLAQDFSFTASDGNRVYRIGDSIPPNSELKFRIQSPKRAVIKLVRNGEMVNAVLGTALEAEGRGPGAYRAEVSDGRQPWIISNPIYLD
jgi:hypothetical protein